jgi:hypothetical protein
MLVKRVAAASPRNMASRRSTIYLGLALNAFFLEFAATDRAQFVGNVPFPSVYEICRLERDFNLVRLFRLFRGHIVVFFFCLFFSGKRKMKRKTTKEKLINNLHHHIRNHNP